jgi:hypothetical protein
MRVSHPAILLCLCSLIPVPLSAQQSTPSAVAAPSLPQPNAQGPALIMQSLAAATGGVQVTDVTLSGTSTVASPTGGQSGSITLTATAIGQEQLTFEAPDGTHTDTRDFSAGRRAGKFSAPNGVGGNTPPQSLPGIHPAWFFPAFVMATGSSSANFAQSDLGQETRNGAAVRHVAIWNQPSGAAVPFQASLQRLTEHDLFLDPATSLPVAMTFRFRAFNPKNPDAPFRPIPTAPVEVEEEVRYSDYRQVQGVPVAFHIQIYMNRALVDDIQISSVAINTGATIAAVN